MQESPVVKAVEDGAETLSSVALSVDGGGGVGRRDLEVKNSVVYSKPMYMFRSVLEAEDVKKPLFFLLNGFVLPAGTILSYQVLWRGI